MALLKISNRDKLGTRHSRWLRHEGFVPGIIYGHGEANTPISMRGHDIEVAVKRGERLLRAELGGQEGNFLIKEVQYDYLGQRILHVDLTRVSLDERVEVTVPIVLRGTAVGVTSEEGVLTQHLNELTVECLVTVIPDELRLPVADLHVNESLRVADLDLPEGVKAMEEPETLIASVTVVAEEVVAAAEEAPAEPELIVDKGEEEPKPAGEEEPD